MQRPYIRCFVALLPLLAAFAVPTPVCLAWCESIPGYECCYRCCQFRLIDGCTHCAWQRTWWGPNALATPLRPYYIPRKPCCYWNNESASAMNCGYSAGESYAADGMAYESLSSTHGENLPQPMTGFAPAQFERLGQIRNELDVVGALGTSPHAAAPNR